jgi:CotS family spore coat protein
LGWYELKYQSNLIKQDIDIDPRILELVPLAPRKITRYEDDCIIWETSQGNLALWIYSGQESHLAYRNQILRVCQQNGLKNFIYPLSLNDGRLYAKYDERQWFFITHWPEFRDISFRNQVDLFSLVNLIITFRKIVADSGVFFYLPEPKEDVNLLNSYQEITDRLNSFALVAKFRLKPTQFDQMFMAHFPEVLIQANQAIAFLKESEYRHLISTVTTQNIIINRFTRSNLRFSIHEGVATILRFNNYDWDLPIIDLAILLVKTGRSSKWGIDWFYNIIMEYQKYFPISTAELEIIFSYLAFPWNFYRLAMRFYFNLMGWPLRTFIEKMERLLDEENHRAKFLIDFKKQFLSPKFLKIE